MWIETIFYHNIRTPKFDFIYTYVDLVSMIEDYTYTDDRVAFDIGGVISKYPQLFIPAIKHFSEKNTRPIYIITDMHQPSETKEMLKENGVWQWLKPENVINADFSLYGEACKAVELKRHNINMFFDDFPAYVCEGCNVKCRVLPDLDIPYYADDWKVPYSVGDFGRRKSMCWRQVK